MKFLKYFLFMILPLVAAACSDDKDEPQVATGLIGEWECMVDAYGDFWDEPLIFVFNEDGTGYEWFSDEPYSYRTRFTYTTTSSELRIKFDSESYFDELRYKLSSNGKSLTIYGLDDDDMSELHFTRTE